MCFGKTVRHSSFFKYQHCINQCRFFGSGCDVDLVRQPGPNGEGGEVVDGQTPLHMASSWGLERTAEMLLQYNAKINAQVRKLLFSKFKSKCVRNLLYVLS